jgi:hypothetical protein
MSESQVKSEFDKWKFAKDLPPVLLINVPHYPLAGASQSGFDINAVFFNDDRILMRQVFYSTPKRIHGLLHYDGTAQLFFMGYECQMCNEIFLVPDEVHDIYTLAEAMKHGCMASPGDTSAYYERSGKKVE